MINLSIVSAAVANGVNSGVKAARSVASGISNPSASGFAGLGTVYGALNDIRQRNDFNNAYSANQASQLRNWQAEQAKIAREYNSAEAAKNRDWQKMMSDTAHQREVKDLLAAGLNPVLSVSGGNGASVGSGSSASAAAPSGSMGETDTSYSNAMVSLLSTFLKMQNDMAMTNINAQNNRAIADQNNAVARLIAEINQATSFGTAKINQDTSFGSAYLNRETQYALQSMIAQQQQYMARNFPNNLWQGLYQMFGGTDNIKNTLLSALGLSESNTGKGVSFSSALQEKINEATRKVGNSTKQNYKPPSYYYSQSSARH